MAATRLERNPAPAGRNDTRHARGGGAGSFADDLGLGRGVVLSRAAASLRSIETKPLDWQICPLLGWTHLPSRFIFLPIFQVASGNGSDSVFLVFFFP